jgi:hypothetical protein
MIAFIELCWIEFSFQCQWLYHQTMITYHGVRLCWYRDIKAPYYNWRIARIDRRLAELDEIIERSD